ncbi:hypothetical protein ABZS66_30995 [Dactylosporangium sp. NPDC005572]|uniref:hypothetical protein n=1 Tax=Dactylosporangium sp. NPDC005572 TaxID=3156889 RepID=UPI0033BC31E3
MRRTGAIVVISALALAGLTGCSAAVEGIAGVRVDADGQLVGILDWCPGKPGADTIVLYKGGDGGVTDEVVELDRPAGPDTRTAEDVVLLAPAGGWQTRRAPAALDDDQLYDLRAWNSNDAAVDDFPFRIGELRGRAGRDTILTKQWDGKRYVATFHTPEDFATYADSRCD